MGLFITSNWRCRAVAASVSVIALMATAQPSPAQQPDTVAIDLPTQPLGQALVALAEQTGLVIVAPDEIVAGRTASALSGRYAPDEAVDRLLAGSGLTARRSSGGAVIIAARQSSARPVQLASASDEAPDMEEMIVTGTKQNLSVQDTQTSVELFSAQRIEREVLFSLDDILLRTANVSATNVQTSFSIRGIDQAGVGFAGTGQTSNIYIDGAPLSVNAQNGAQSLWDVGQVEVLRGPQSTVQGRNALAGAIILNTKDPTYDWEVGGRLHVATQESVKASGVVSGPILADQLAFRIAYDYQTYDGGVVEATTGIPQEFQDSHTIRGKLLVEPGALPGLRVELNVERVDTEFGEFNTRFAPVPFNDPAFDDFDPFGDETFTRVRLEDSETTKYIGDVSYQITDRWTLIGLGTYEDHFRLPDFCTPAAGVCELIGGNTFTDRYSGEVRAAFDYGRTKGWLGGYYFRSETSRNFGFDLPAAGFGRPVDPPDAILTISSRQVETTENYAIFGDVTFDLNDRWSFNVGARYDWEDFVDSGRQGTVTAQPDNCVAELPFGPASCALLFPVTNDPAQPASFEAFLPRGGITYSFDQDRSVSFAVQRGYRAGGSVVQFIEATGAINVVPFDPEFVTNYELAFRSQWLDRRLTVNANLFYTDWSDQQISIPGPSGSPAALDAIVVNAGSSRLYGLELSVSARPTDGLDLFATLGLLDTEFTNFPFVDTPSQTPNEFENLAGNTFPSAPNVTVAAGVSYEHTSGAYTNWTLSYRGPQESEVANLDVNEVDGYVLVNARIGYNFGAVNLYAFANNLFDDRFATRNEFTAVNRDTGEIVIRDNARFQVNEPRVAGIALEVRF